MLLTLKCRVFLSVLEHLAEIAVLIYDFVINDLATLLYRDDLRIEESAVWLQTQSCVALENFFVEGRVDVYCIFLYQSLTCFIVAF